MRVSLRERYTLLDTSANGVYQLVMQHMWGLIRGFSSCSWSVGSEKESANERSRVPACARGRRKAGILRVGVE